MRTLNKNKQLFYFAMFKGKTDSVDEYGNITGEPKVSYYDPIAMLANISASKGTADVEQFGVNLNYTKTIVTDDMTCPIDEHSIIWIGISDPLTAPHNYVVTAIAKSLNFITYAIKEVETSV